MSYLAAIAFGIEKDIVVDEDVLVGDIEHLLARGIRPSTGKVIGPTRSFAALRDTVIAQPHHHQIAIRADAVTGVMSHEDVVATCRRQPATGVVDEVVNNTDVVRLVVDPGRLEELKPGALPGHDAMIGAIENLVPLDQQIGATALDVHDFVQGVVDAAADDVTEVDGDIVDRIVPGPVELAVLDIQVLAQRRLEVLTAFHLAQRSPGHAGHAADQHIITMKQSKDAMALIGLVRQHVHIQQVKVVAARETNGREDRLARSVGRLDNDRTVARAIAHLVSRGMIGFSGVTPGGEHDPPA